MQFPWSVFIDFGLLSLALILATFIRSRVRFFQRFLIPNALTAGFLLLPFYNFLAPRLGITALNLETFIYHFLSVSFIAMSLRNPPKRGSGKRILSVAVIIICSFTVQIFIGLVLSRLSIAAAYPEMHPTFGLLIPLSYEMGPGQAFSIGKGWEALGFQGAGSIGLTFAALGFLWACFGGVILINWGVKKGWLKGSSLEAVKASRLRSGFRDSASEVPAGGRLTTNTEAIDSFTLNLAIVLGTYLITYLLLKLLTFILSFAGPDGKELAVNLWGISFIFAALIAILVRSAFRRAGADHILDSGTLTRITGVSVDFLVVSAIAAISLTVVIRFIVPIIVMGILAGVITMIYVMWLSSRLFDEDRFHRAMMIYGASTGTMPTGLALLRVIDPEFKTPVAVDYMYASGLVFFLIIPYILTINLPIYAVSRSRPAYLWTFIGIASAYFVLVIVSSRILGGKKFFSQPFKLWRD